MARAATSTSLTVVSAFAGIGRIDEHGHTSRFGHQLAQEFQPLCLPTRHLKTLIPVRLPPGRARLATRPSLTGSSLTEKTIGIVAVAAFAASAETLFGGDDHGDPAANQIGRKRRQPIVLILGQAVFDCDVLAFYIAGLLQALAECAQTVRERVRRCGCRETRSPASPAAARAPRAATQLPRRPV